jgi:hypothetical protein
MVSGVDVLSLVHKRISRQVIFIVLGIAGALLLLANSTWGIGVTHDSVFYLNSASNLTHGEGLSWIGDRGRIRPLTHFAPFYPLVLSPFIALGVDPEVAALWIALISFGLIIFLTGYFVSSVTERTSSGVLTSVLTLLSPVILGVHTIALSEPVFLLITLCFLAALGRYLSKPSGANFLLIVILAALGYLTRYVGVTLLLTGACAILVFRRNGLGARLRDSAIFVLLAFFPMALWMLRNYSLTGTMTNRTLGFHPPSGQTVLNFFGTVASWIFPFPFGEVLRTLIVLAATLALAYVSVRALKRSPQVLKGNCIPLLALFLLVYMSSLAFSITLVDAATPLDNRILSPAYLSLLLFSVLVLGGMSKCWNNALPRIVILLLLGVVIWSDLIGTSSTLQELSERGIGFTSQMWQESETLAWVDGLAKDSLIYTNERFALTYITGRSAISIPEKINTVTAQIRPEFDQALVTMHQRLETPHAYLVLFHPFGLRNGMPTRDEITFPLSRLKEFEDAWVYIDPINIE